MEKKVCTTHILKIIRIILIAIGIVIILLGICQISFKFYNILSTFCAFPCHSTVYFPIDTFHSLTSAPQRNDWQLEDNSRQFRVEFCQVLLAIAVTSGRFYWQFLAVFLLPFSNDTVNFDAAVSRTWLWFGWDKRYGVTHATHDARKGIDRVCNNIFNIYRAVISLWDGSITCCSCLKRDNIFIIFTLPLLSHFRAVCPMNGINGLYSWLVTLGIHKCHNSVEICVSFVCELKRCRMWSIWQL